MRSKEEILEKAEKRIHDLEYFDFMGMLAENKRADLELLRELVALVEEQPKVGEWIPCSERLPENPEFGYQGYLVQNQYIEEPYTAFWNGSSWEDIEGLNESDITAWMLLPEPYKAD